MLNNALKQVMLFLLAFYQTGISPYKMPCCRFYPSCSSYAIQAVEKYGVSRGMLLAVKRLCRCHPFAKGGYDPVP